MQSPTPRDLAAAFDIPTHRGAQEMNGGASSAAGSSGSNGEEPARTLKRLRLVWTPQLHKRRRGLWIELVLLRG